MLKPVLGQLKQTTKRDEPRLDSDTFKLEEAYEAARDARDIIRDKQRRDSRQLPDYTGEDEDTKRTNVHVHVHSPSPSKPDIEVETEVSVGPFKAKGLPKWAVVAILGVVAIVTALVARFAH